MKIVYCIDRLSFLGGIEKITIAKANALAEVPGNKVYIVVMENSSSPIHTLSDKVSLVNLDITHLNDYKKNRIQAYYILYKKYKLHKKKLKDFLLTINPDIIISTNSSEKHFIRNIHIPSNPVIIREIHYNSNYRYIYAKSIWEKLLAVIGQYLDYHFIQNIDRIIVLTHEDKERNWKNNPKVAVIPNPLIANPEDLRTNYNNKIAIAVGRLSFEKNFISLINAWNLVHQKHPNWILQIWGKGPQEDELRHKINEYKLKDNILLMGTSNEIHKKMSNASIFILSSICEGFGMVLIEAMSCGLPVISYDCPCGPKDIIRNNLNGILVTTNDEKMLASHIIELIEDMKTMSKIGHAAIERSHDFSMDKIIAEWMKLFNNSIKAKKQTYR